MKLVLVFALASVLMAQRVFAQTNSPSTASKNPSGTPQDVVRRYLTAIYQGDFKTFCECAYNEDAEVVRLEFEATTSQNKFRKLLDEKYGQSAPIDFNMALPKNCLVEVNQDMPATLGEFLTEPIVAKEIKGQTNVYVEKFRLLYLMDRVGGQWRVDLGTEVRKDLYKDRCLIPSIKFFKKGIELLQHGKVKSVQQLASLCSAEIAGIKPFDAP